MATTSALAADFGSVNTRVVVFDVVDGEYRLIARGLGRTTDMPPVNDYTIGFQRVVRAIQDSTGRQLLENGRIVTPEQAGRTGVDEVVVTASVGRPLRAVLIGLMPDVSIASALRATAGTYIDVVATIALNDGRSEEDRLNTILLNAPDIVFIVGGTEDGAITAVLELSRVAQLAISLIADKSRRPTVIYAGNHQLEPQITTMFDDLTTLFIAQNVRPDLDDEHLESARQELAEAFDYYKETHSEGFDVISEMSQVGLLPTAQSYGTIAEFLGATTGENVALIDVGSSTSVLAVSFKKRSNISIRTDLGLGHSAAALLDTVRTDTLRGWLPFNAPASELYNYSANKSLRPAMVPLRLRDLYIEHALLRAGARTLIADARPAWEVEQGPLRLNRVIGAGAGLTNLGNPGYTAMLLLDVFQPAGVTQLDADPYGLIPAMGALAFRNPLAVVQLLDGGALERVGTAISPTGKPRENRTAMRISITHNNGDVVEHQLDGGHLWVYPLSVSEQVSVTVKLSSEMNIAGKRNMTFEVTGGKAGLIFDARGRPLALAETAQGRAEQMPQWIAEATGDEVIEIDPAWLEEEAVEDLKPVEVPLDVEPQAEKKKKRRGLFRRRRKQAEDTDDKPAVDDVIDNVFDADDDDLDFGEFEDDNAAGKRKVDDELGDLRSGILS